MPVNVNVTPVLPVNVVGIVVPAVELEVQPVPPVPLKLDTDPPVPRTRFVKVFGSVLTDTVLAAEHLLSTISNLVVLHPDGREVSVEWSLTGLTVEVKSNVNLNNHILIII